MSAAMALPLPDVTRIAVLRPCAVGDFVFALPALTALRETYPQASITLLGKPWQAEFLAGRPGPIDRVVVLPPVCGVGAAPDAVEDPVAIARFLDDLNAEPFDLAIQLYGGGGYSNPFLRRIAARHYLGMHAPDAPRLTRSLPYVYLQNERLRLLEVVGLVGARTATLDARLAVLPRDLAEADRAVPPAEMPLVLIQPGATDPRRRWPPEHFAAVADALVAAGARIAVNGGPDERELVRAVIASMHHPAIDLVAHGLSLSGLVGVLRRATLLVSNDTGPLHLAQAVGTASVGIYWFTNLLISAPLVAARQCHTVSLRVHCPECGREIAQAPCSHTASLVADVAEHEVRQAALTLYREVSASRAIASLSTV